MASIVGSSLTEGRYTRNPEEGKADNATWLVNFLVEVWSSEE